MKGYCTLPSECEIPNCDGMTDACTTPEYCQDVSKNICCGCDGCDDDTCNFCNCGCDGCDDDTCNFCKKSECLEGVCPDICPKDCCETPACIQDACDAVNVACDTVSTGVGGTNELFMFTLTHFHVHTYSYSYVIYICGIIYKHTNRCLHHLQ